MVNRFAQPWNKTSVNISPEMYRLCVEHQIRFSEAMRRGISLILAEKNIKEYDSDLNITRRVTELKLKASDALQRLANIENNKNISEPQNLS